MDHFGKIASFAQLISCQTENQKVSTYSHFELMPAYVLAAAKYRCGFFNLFPLKFRMFICFLFTERSVWVYYVKFHLLSLVVVTIFLSPFLP